MPPPATSAGSVEANRIPPPGPSATYSGLIPSRSRARITRPVSASHRAKANMPLKRSSIPSRHSAQPLRITSVSDVEAKVCPARSSSARSSL